MTLVPSRPTARVSTHRLASSETSIREEITMR
jgi:hypothetical protein